MTEKHKHDKKPGEEHPSPAGLPAPAVGKGEVKPPEKIELDRLAAQELVAAEYKDKYLRALADGENSRKRLEKDRKEYLEFAVQDLVGELLPVLDNFERAQAAAPGSDKDPYRQGIDMIYKQLKEALGKEGLRQIAAKGEVFDPFLHEAVAEEETAAHPDGTILEELQKGYLLKGRLLRPAAVKVARSPVPPPPAPKP